MHTRAQVDRPVAVIDAVNTASPVTYFVHVDHLNRPTRMPDDSKATVWNAIWTPRGAPYTGTASLNARFPGQWFQIESGLHYNWYRYYDPFTGRHTQPDPLGFVDGPSVFAYAGSSPLIYSDPSGQFWQLPIQICARFPALCDQQCFNYLFGRSGYFNKGPNLRIGIGRKGGREVFRIAGKWVRGTTGRKKIDIKDLGQIKTTRIDKMFALTEQPECWFTTLQLACACSIARTLQSDREISFKLAPRPAVSEAMHGTSDTVYYLLGCIEAAEIEFWIYQDEPMYFKSGKFYPFEKEGYKTESDLIVAFVDAISSGS